MATPKLPCSNCRARHIKCDRQKPKCGRCKSRNIECIPVERKAVFRRGRVSRKHDFHENTFTVNQTWVNSRPRKWKGAKSAVDGAQQGESPNPGRLHREQESASEGADAVEVNLDRIPRQTCLDPNLDHLPVEECIDEGSTGIRARTGDSGLEGAILARAPDDGHTPLTQLNVLVSAAVGSQAQHDSSVAVQGVSYSISASPQSPYSSIDSPVSSYQPLASIEESCLLRYFIEELSPWFDHCDPQSHFRRVVPLRAQRSRYPSLLNAIFAVSARHLSRLPQYRTLEGNIKYHGQSLPDLSTSSAVEYMLRCIPGLSSFHDIGDPIEQENLMCAAIILRQYEEMEEEMEEMGTGPISFLTDSSFGNENAGEGDSPTEKQVNFLAITQTIIQAMISASSPLQRSPLAVAAYWIAVRQEVYYALTRKRAPCLTFTAQDWESATVANKMIMHAGEVTKWCWGDRTLGEYAAERLRHHQQQLITAYSSQLAPILHRLADRTNGEIFPTVWYATDAQVTGVQHLEMARMILIAENPRLLENGVLRSMHRKTEFIVRNIVLNLCGIAVDVSRRMPALVNAVISILLYGEYFTDLAERNSLLNIIERMKDMRAWPLRRGVERLQRAWREADNVEF